MWFLPYIHMHQSWMYMCAPILNPQAPLPPRPIPLGCPRAPASSALLHASILHWSAVLHMVIYMFQFYSLKLSHPCLLPHSPKVCSLHLCLFCIQGRHFCVSKFHIYALIYYIDVSLYDLLYSIYLGSSFIHLIRTDSNAFLFI